MKTDDKKLKRIWYGMIRRCHGKSIPQRVAVYYRDKGITVCDAWRNDFTEFKKWSIENGYSEGMSIDRIDSDKNYCPENCQWITRSENSRKAVADNRNKPHRSEVGHFMVIEKVIRKHCHRQFVMYKVIKTGLYKSEANAIAKKLNSELPPWESRYMSRVTLNCKEGETVFWEQTGQYLNKK